MKLTKQKLDSLIEEVLQERESDIIRISVINMLLKDFLKIENFNVYKHKRESYFFEMKQSQVDSFVDWALKEKNLKKFFTLIPRLKKLPQEDLPKELKKLATEASFRIHSEEAWIKHFPSKKNARGFYSQKRGLHIRAPYNNLIFRSLGEKQVFNIVKNIEDINSVYVHEYGHAIQGIQGMKAGDYHNREWQNRPQEIDARFYQGLKQLTDALQKESYAAKIFKLISESRQKFLDFFVNNFAVGSKELKDHDEKSQRRIYNRSYDILVMIEKMPEFEQWKEDQKNRSALRKLIDGVIDWFYEEAEAYKE